MTSRYKSSAIILALIASIMPLADAKTVFYNNNFVIPPELVLNVSDMNGNYSLSQIITPGTNNDIVIWGISVDSNKNYWVTRRALYGDTLKPIGSDISLNTSFPEAPKIASIADGADSSTGILYRQTIDGNQSIILLIINAEGTSYTQNITIVSSNNTEYIYPEIGITSTSLNYFLIWYTEMVTESNAMSLYSQTVIAATGLYSFLFNRLMTPSGTLLPISQPSCGFITMNNTYSCLWLQDNLDGTAFWLAGTYDIYGSSINPPSIFWTNNYTTPDIVMNAYVQVTANLVAFVGENVTFGNVVGLFEYDLDGPTTLAKSSSSLMILNNTLTWSDRDSNGIFVGYRVSFSDNTTVIEKYLGYNQLGFSIGSEQILVIDGNIVAETRSNNDTLYVGIVDNTGALYVGGVQYAISSAIRTMVTYFVSIFMLTIVVFGL